MFGLVERKENKCWDSGIFFLNPPKNFLSKIERKMKEKIEHHFWKKMPMCNCTWASSTLLFFILFFLWMLPAPFLLFLFYFLLWTFAASSSLFFFFFFFFFFYLLGRLVQYSFLFFFLSFAFFFLFFLFSCDFFMDMIFIFLINLGV